MKIRRKTINSFLKGISLCEKNEKFSLQTKYKILKIKELLKQENDYTAKILRDILVNYPKDDKGNYLIPNEDLSKVQSQIIEFDEQEIILPDLYFSIDEFEDSEISWEALEILMPFIKE